MHRHFFHSKPVYLSDEPCDNGRDIAMGEDLIRLFKYKIKRSWKTIFISTFIIGLFVHIYKFTNSFLNHDSLFCFYSDQDMLGSGRWFLSFACSFSSCFDLPWVTGLLSIILISLTAVVVADVFKIENPFLLILTGGLLVSFPAITHTFYFQYTADGYMLAMLLAALSVRFSLIGGKGPWRIALSCLFICLSCGIYQAYVSFALLLAVCHFVQKSLEGYRTNREMCIWVGKQAFIYGVGISVYYFIWQILMKIRGITAISYEGLDQIGQNSLQILIGKFKYSIIKIIYFFMEWNVFKDGFTRYSALNLIFLLLFASIVIYATVKSKIYKRKLQFFLFLAAFASIPVMAYILMFVSPGVGYGIRMEQSLCVLFIFAGVLFCKWAKSEMSNIMATVLIFIILNNSLSANLFYMYMEKANKSCYAMATELTTRIHLLDDGKVRNIAIIGELSWEDYSEDFKKDPGGLRELGGLREIGRNFLSYDINVAGYLYILDFQLAYYIEHPEAEIPEISEQIYPIVPDTWRMRFPLCDSGTKKDIASSPEFEQMGCWPASDSVKVMGETVVIKFSAPDPGGSE